jgi:hypothetical protein
MAKYDPLRNFLHRRRRTPECELTFAEIERVIGAMLPKAAQRHEWWAGFGPADYEAVQRKAWASVGFEARPVVERERVRFVRAP